MIKIPAAEMKRLIKQVSAKDDLLIDTERGLLVSVGAELTTTVRSSLLVSPEKFVVACEGKKIGQVVGRMAGAIDIALVGSSLVLKSARATIQIDTKPAKPFIAPEFKDTITLPLDKIKPLLQYASQAVDPNKAAVTGGVVKLKSKPLTPGALIYGIQAAGSDGHRLFIEESEAIEESKFLYVLPLPAVAAIQALEGTTLEVAEMESYFYFKAGGVSIFSGKLSKALPNYENFIPKTFKSVYSVNAEALKNSLRVVQPMFDPDQAGNPNRATVHFLDNVCRIFTKSAEDSVECKQLLPDPIFDAIIDFKITVNAEYLLDFVSAVSGEVTVSCNEVNQPLWLEAGNRKMLLAPVNQR